MKRRSGFTLLEVLVALALATVVAASLGAMLRATGRVSERLDALTQVDQLRQLAGALLRGEIERAGRGGEEQGGRLALYLDPTNGGGDVIEVAYLAEADRVEPTLLDAAFFAARDSRGRPNLYRQPPGSVRQPWLLGVVGVHVVAGRNANGAALDRHDLVPGAAIVGLEVELRFASAPPVRIWASTRRAERLASPELGDGGG